MTVIKDDLFERLVNEHLIVDFDLLFDPYIEKCYNSTERKFGVVDIEIFQIVKLRVDQKYNKIDTNKQVLFRFVVDKFSPQDFLLLINEVSCPTKKISFSKKFKNRKKQS